MTGDIALDTTFRARRAPADRRIGPRAGAGRRTDVCRGCAPRVRKNVPRGSVQGREGVWRDGAVRPARLVAR
ncbi:hypothetical protein GCM10017688_19600 [Streptomyces ramulosus]